MVEFLVEKGADINRGDNEGWTPLHATASCGFISIAKLVLSPLCCSMLLTSVGNHYNVILDLRCFVKRKTTFCRYLIEKGCNLAAVNNDGELALDITESDEMEDMLQQHINESGLCLRSLYKTLASLLNESQTF